VEGHDAASEGGKYKTEKEREQSTGGKIDRINTCCRRCRPEEIEEKI